MNELRELKDVETQDGVMYLRFSKHQIESTKTYANGEINVDLDAYDEVVGIEVLSLGPDEFAALATVVQERQLSLDRLAHATR